EVLDAFRSSYPDNKLVLEASKQIANAYKQSGQRARAAGEYEHLASKSDDPALRSESLLLAGDLYAQSNGKDHALEAYRHYIDEFPKPIETALETRNKIAEIYKASNDEARYKKELAEIVPLDAAAGAERRG